MPQTPDEIKLEIFPHNAERIETTDVPTAEGGKENFANAPVHLVHGGDKCKSNGFDMLCNHCWWHVSKSEVQQTHFSLRLYQI